MLKEALLKFVEIAKIRGLNEIDLNHSLDYLEHDEFGLCFDTIITQMYEFDITIDDSLYDSISKIAKKMEMNQDDYSFLEELVNNEDVKAQTQQKELATLVASW